MYTTIGLCFILTILSMLPLVFCFAGKDTEQRSAAGRERLEEALLDWTDKEVIAAERAGREGERKRMKRIAATRVETVKRESLPQFAA